MIHDLPVVFKALLCYSDVLFKYVTLKHFETKVFGDTKFDLRCAIHTGRQRVWN